MERADLERGRASEPLVRACALHHLVLETPDLDVAERFYGDFGHLPSARTSAALYLRSLGPAHHVLKLSLEGALQAARAVASSNEASVPILVRAARALKR